MKVHGNTKHGMCKTTEYEIWCGIVKRTTNPNHKYYQNYGGRGIKICDRWRKSFLSFYEDMGKRPSLAHSIDRINVDGDYEPKNCRWATTFEQALNKRIRKDNKSGVTGVYWSKQYNAFMCYINRYGVRRYVGRFNTVEEAALARKLVEAEQ